LSAYIFVRYIYNIDTTIKLLYFVLYIIIFTKIYTANTHTRFPPHLAREGQSATVVNQND
jgi:hypothetical protein